MVPCVVHEDAQQQRSAVHGLCAGFEQHASALFPAGNAKRKDNCLDEVGQMRMRSSRKV
jgi:hypothetical protein